MKKRIVLSLALLSLLFFVGLFFAARNVQNSTKIYNYLIKLHQIENLRHDLVLRVIRVQSDLYTVNTSLSQGLESIIENVDAMDRSSRDCTHCHHTPLVSRQLDELQEQVEAFKNSLSFFITASANAPRIEALKAESANLGSALLYHSEQMSYLASANLDKVTRAALTEIENARTLFGLILALSCLCGGLIAVYLTRSITRPTQALVRATRRITAGDLGFTINHRFHAEFAELADHFNEMSQSLAEGYTKLQGEIAERRTVETALRESEARYALAARGANDGLWDWDLRTDTLYLSPRWMAMLGCTEEELGRHPEAWLERIHPEDRGEVDRRLAAHLGGKTEYFESEYRIRHRDDHYRWMLCRGIAVRDGQQRPSRMAGSQTDITGRKLVEEKLRHDALYDALTDLPNRNLFLNRLEHRIHTARRRPEPAYAVLFLDLDRFKFVNDNLGHHIGDQLLVAVGQRLMALVRPNDTVARLGGDEFALLLDDLREEDQAVEVAERIQADLVRPFSLHGHEVYTSASIGIALADSDYDSSEKLLRDADLAMYQAKNNGKARHEIFHGSGSTP